VQVDLVLQFGMTTYHPHCWAMIVLRILAMSRMMRKAIRSNTPMFPHLKA